MKFTFETTNINERAYKRAINRYVLENFGRTVFRSLKDWKFIVRPSTRIGEEPFFDGAGNGTGGVTGLGEVRVYVYDNTGFGLIFRTNISTICHELAHAALLTMPIGSTRIPLLYDDLSGNKEGDRLNYSTAEVHNRQMGKWTYTATEWLWTGLTYSRISYTVLDFRDHYD